MFKRKLNAIISDGSPVPRRAHGGDAGLDLRITRAITLRPMERCVVGCGMAVEIPSGCVGLLFPRSGISAKDAVTLTNAVGVIDSGYRGEIHAPLINLGYETVELEAGTRVCQLVIMPYVPCEIVPVESLGESDRGSDAFGSTGRS